MNIDLADVHTVRYILSKSVVEYVRSLVERVVVGDRSLLLFNYDYDDTLCALDAACDSSQRYILNSCRKRLADTYVPDDDDPLHVSLSELLIACLQHELGGDYFIHMRISVWGARHLVVTRAPHVSPRDAQIVAEYQRIVAAAADEPQLDAALESLVALAID